MSDAHATGEQRLGIVTGDRLCTQCGYNLLGQPTQREPHYRLVIIRCPECATVAAVQEYPLLGRWANRWGAVLAALWFILLVAAWPASSGVIFGWSINAGEESSWPYATYLTRLQRDAQAAAAPPPSATPSAAAPATPAGPGAPAPTPGQTTFIQTPDGRVIALPPGMNVATGAAGGQDFENWWAQQDPAALFAQAGGLREAVSWEALLLWIPLGIMALLIGWFWSVALLQFRKRWVLVWALAIIGLAALFSLAPLLDWMQQPPTRASAAAHATIGVPFLCASLAFGALVLMAGVAIGRSATRGLVRALLPPRMRGSLAILWTAEGKTVPSGAAQPSIMVSRRSTSATLHACATHPDARRGSSPS